MTTRRQALAPAESAATVSQWINWGLETLWLLAVFLTPLAFFDRDYAISEAAIAYVEVPKIALLRTLAGLMAILWLIEWGIQGRLPFQALFSGEGPRLGPASWVARLRGWLRDRPTRWLLLAVWLFMGTTLLSTLLSGSRNISLWGEVPGQDGYPAYTVLAYVLLFSVVATHLKARAQLWRLIGAIVLMGTLVAGYAIFQHYTIDFLNLTEQTGGGAGEVTAMMGNSLFAGALMTMTIPLTLMATIYGIRTPVGTPGWSWESLARLMPALALAGLLSAALTIQLLGITFTFARGPWVGMIVATAGMLGLVVVFTGWRALGRAALVLGLTGWSGVALLQGLASISILGLGPWFGLVIALAGLSGLAAVFVTWRKFGGVVLVLGATVTLIVTLAAGILLGATWFSSGDTDFLGGARGGASGSASKVAEQFSSIKGEVLGGFATGRGTHWKVSWTLFREHPWFEFDNLSLRWLRPLIGYGPDLYRYTYLLESPTEGVDLLPLEPDHAHNFFIHQMVELGFFGFLSSLGIFAAVFFVGGYQLLWQRSRYSQLHTLILIGLLATLAGRFLEMQVGVARVSDLTILWVLLAMFAALPGVMEGPETASEAAPREPTRRRSRDRSSPVTPAHNQYLVLTLALAAVLVLVILLLTWLKTVSNVRAAVETGEAAAQFRQGELQATLAALNRAIALAPDVPIYYNYRTNVFLTYQIRQVSPPEPGCSSGENPAYQECLAFRGYQSNLEGVNQRPFYYRSHLALANSAFNLKGTEYDVTRDGEVTTVRLREEAARYYRESLALVPNSWRIANELAEAYLELEEPQKALKPLEGSLAITGDRPLSARASALLGLAYHELGESEKSAAALERGLEFGLPGDFKARPLEALAEIYSGSGRWELAGGAFFQQGKSHFTSGELEKSTQAFQSSVTSYEKSGQPQLQAKALHQLGRAYFKLGDTERASEPLLQSLELAPSGPLTGQVHTVLVEVYATLQQTYENSGQWVLAGDAIFLRAVSHLELGRLQEAERAFQSSAATYEKSSQPQLEARSLFQAGLVFYNLDHPGRASIFLENSLSVEPFGPLARQVHRALVDVYLALGLTDNAEMHRKRANR